jgi:hypothetical protein
VNPLRKLMPFAVMALAATISCSGCKTNPQKPATTSPGTQPGNGTQATIPAGQTQPTSQQPAPSQAGGAVAPPPGSPQVPAQSAAIDLPTGTRIRVRLDQDLGSKISRPGDRFGATVADDVQVNGQTVIARGARAEGTVIDAKPLGKIKGGAYLAVRLERVHTNWGSYPVSTSSVDRAEKGKGKRSGEFIGGGAGVGALIGGLAGGGRGALIGGLAGGGAGTAGGAFTGNKQIFLPA